MARGLSISIEHLSAILIVVYVCCICSLFFGIINDPPRHKHVHMRRIFSGGLIILLVTFMICSCDTIKNLPTNTTGGLFSLNGNWRLASTTDNNALVGTTI